MPVVTDDASRMRRAQPGGAAIALIRLYQRHAPAGLRASCRFEPTCSQYTILSIRKHGVLAGSLRGVQRFLRCRPPNGGLDQP